jgi:hypothetical protein
MKKRILSAVVLSQVLLLSTPAMAGWSDHDGGKCDKREKSGQNHAHFGGHHDRKGGKWDRDLELTSDEVKTLVTSRLIYRGNDRLQVGEVTSGEKNTYKVEIVTKDNSLVEVLTISGATGFPVAQN